MYLRQIELLGFKSFPTKTTVKFATGVTSIVGPNGCGKTNVLDALRWVLGEQKPTLLRGGKMEEVIFNGTAELKPLGMAEVTLTIVNNSGILPTEYHELQITRRLFRSGESEYLINKVPCRLKDIIDMFVDTGLGAHSYSVIQQHMIDSVISDKAEERRFLFEEAAGITKYKQRRKAALRKLEATENDFLRLKDIYAEVKTRVNALYRQHKKAERYKKLEERIRSWELYLGASRLRQLQQEKRELQSEYDSLTDQKTSRGAVLDLAAGQLESDRRDQVDIEQRLNAIGNEIYTVSEEAHRVEREISVLNEKKANAALTITKGRSDLQSFDTRTEELHRELAETEARLATARQQLQARNDELTRAQAKQAEVDQTLLAARTAQEVENRKLLELEGRLSSGVTEESALREQTDELTAMAAQLEQAIAANNPRQKEMIEQTERLREDLTEMVRTRADTETRRKEVVAAIEECMEQGEGLSLQLSDFKASLEACEARRLLLEDMMLHYEGYESGVVTTMSARDRWPDLVGTVADKFVPREGMETVLQAALGEMARYLICRDRVQAESIIAYLRSQGKGRVGILVPLSGTITPGVRRPEMEMPGVIGWLDTLVTTEESLRTLKEAVLSRMIVFGPGADVDAILERLPYGFGAVSTEGVLYQKNLISGGSDDVFSLFRRRERIAEQDREIALIQQKIDAVANEKNRSTARLGALRAESEQLNSRLEDMVQEIEEQQRQLNEAEFAGRTLMTELERLNREKHALAARIVNMRGRQQSLGLDAHGLAGEKTTLLAEIEQATLRLRDLEQQAVEANAEVSRLQVEAIEARSRVEQTEHQIVHINQLLAEIEQNRGDCATEVEQARQDIECAEAALGTMEQALKTAFEQRDRLAQVQLDLRARQAEVMNRTAEKEATLKRLRQEREAVADQLHKAEVRLTAVGSAVTALIDRLRAEYDTDISTMLIGRPQEEISDEDAPALISDLREKLKNFGAVNLVALEEYEVTAEREKFLSAQLNDLTIAKNDLRSTITKINKTARDLFTTTFDKVQENFSKLFVELFAGGEARITLVNPEDPLESDIEITARPGGKKLLPITMLSGGERALTAISLLFSLYLVKPSPFCILDEIDAPLDDANCQRFLKIIKHFSLQTQFIVITHNKITMEASDNLYGITMERPGVSKLVAVKFARQDDGSDELVTVEAAAEPASETADQEPLPEAILERITPAVTIKPDGDA
ncbi:MAG: chromosome segregation protein SMC [Candidatus Zixiibacteriota bacterium]